MTDIASGGADAPAAPSAVPVATDHAPQTQALGSQTPVAEKPPAPPEPAKQESAPKPEKAEPSKTAGDAISKALATVKANQEAKAKAAEPTAPAAKEEPAKPAQPRSEGGQFASSQPKAEAPAPAPQAQQQSAQPSPHRDAPARFSPDAKSAWEATSEPVKAEIHRAIRELEQGHQKYRADAEAFDSIRDFDALAKQHGTDLKTALVRYTNMERLLASDPIKGLHELARNMGLPLRDLAAAIVGQAPDQVQSHQDHTIRQLQAQIQQLTQQVGGVSQSIETDKRTAITNQVEKFAEDHPRLDELANDIEFFLTNKRASNLAEAYDLAERLNPAPASTSPAPAAAPAPAPDIPAEPKPLNPAGQKSISGAPSSGSDPANKRPPASNNREALDRAFARVGS